MGKAYQESTSLSSENEDGIRQTISGRSGNVRIQCLNPGCSGSQDNSLSIDAETGAYQCFRCEAKGNVFHQDNPGDKKPIPEYLWEKATSCTKHPYLNAKGVKSYGLRRDKHGNLVIPLSQNGHISTIQFISEAGKKNLLKKEKGGRKQGASFQVGTGTGDTLYIVEGYATGASIYEATGKPCFMVVDAGNIKPASENLRQTYPDKHFIFCADNDRDKDPQDTNYDVGYLKAVKAAQAVGGLVCMPEQPGYDFNDLAQEQGLEAVKRAIEQTEASEEYKTIWDSPVDLSSYIDIEPEPIKWFVQDRIVMGRGAVLTGVGGSSKTRLLYHLAAGAAIGHLPWDWDVSTKGKSILVLTEDVFEDLHRTIHNLCLSLDISIEEKKKIYNSIIPYPLAGQDVKLLTKAKSGTLEKSNLFQLLSNKIKSMGDIAFIGLDPALSLTDGDELDQGNQRTLGKMADDLAVQTGAVCALVTHATKGSLSKDELTSHNSRGGGAITDVVRAEFVMRTMTAREAGAAQIQDAEERFRHVQLVGTKGNYLPPSAYIPTWLRRDEHGMLKGSDVCMQEGAEPNKKEMRALEFLREISSGGHEVALRDWRDKLIEAEEIQQGTKEAQKKIMNRIRKKLSECGYIEKGHRQGFWRPTDENNYLDFN